MLLVLRQRLVWPISPTRNPLLDHLHLVLGKPTIGGHLVALITDRLVDQTPIDITTVERRTRIPSLFDPIDMVEPKPPFGFPGLSAVTRPTTLRQDRSDTLLEKLHILVLPPTRQGTQDPNTDAR
jgi:hypothetical protein